MSGSVAGPTPGGAAGERSPGAATAPDPSDDPGRRRPPRWATIPVVVGLIGAVVAALSSATTVADWVKDRFDPPPPPVVESQLVEAVLDRRDTLGDYLGDTSQSAEGLSRPQLRELGLVFEVGVRITGTVGQHFPLRWSVYDERRQRRLAGEAYNQTAAEFTPQGETHSSSVPIWIPYPPRRGLYTVRFLLTDADGRPVDQKTTRRFRIDRVPRVAS